MLATSATSLYFYVVLYAQSTVTSDILEISKKVNQAKTSVSNDVYSTQTQNSKVMIYDIVLAFVD